MRQIDATAEQVQKVKRRLIEASAKPYLDRLQLMTMAKPPQRRELLDALLLCSTKATGLPPMERVFQCWQRWMVLMHQYESFGEYARRNIRDRP